MFRRTTATVLVALTIVGSSAGAASAGHTWLAQPAAQTNGSTWAAGSAWK